MEAPSSQTAFAAAVDFVARQDDGHRTILARHRRRPDGVCAGCSAASTPWPCTVAAVAAAATHRATHVQPVERS